MFTAFGEYEGEDGVFSSYLLEGIELFEPVLTDYGSILGTDVDDDMAHLKRDEGCFRFPSPTGDRFYAPLPEFLPCLSSSASGPSWNFDTPKCSPGDQSMLIEFKWIEGPCGLEQDEFGIFSVPADLPTALKVNCDHTPFESSAGVASIVLNPCMMAFALRTY